MKLPVELQPHEALILRVRRHPAYLWVKLAGAALLGIVPPLVALWLGLAIAGLDGAPRLGLIGVCALWAAYAAGRCYFIWYRHQHDEWIVTNQRLIDSYKRNWFDHKLSSADLVNVQDIFIDKSGPLATILDFGDVRCQTAGTNATFVLSAIPRPSRVLGVIDAARDAARQELQSGRPRTAVD